MEVSFPLGEHPPTPPTHKLYQLLMALSPGILFLIVGFVLLSSPSTPRQARKMVLVSSIALLLMGLLGWFALRIDKASVPASQDISSNRRVHFYRRVDFNRRLKYLRWSAPPPIGNGITIQMEPTAQPNIASSAQLSPGSANPLLSIAPGPMTFTYEELVTATKGFSTANFLGQGGFGDVHKGVLPSGRQVAVKQLKAGSKQGEREFQAEVEIISRVHHRHLVSLVGYCMSGTQMMLVYEYVPNNTLKFHLHEKREPTLSWATRIKIALGSAKGLAYLHDDCEPNIIHRDIKADNILLDNNFVAKVADFGLAKFFPDDDTHVSTQIKGTFGYLDPEYASSEKLSDKSDVYSFGVVLLELITGRRPIYKTQSSEKENLVVWARPLLKQALEGGNCDTLVDPRLQGYDSSEMARMVACAAACVRQSGVLRFS